MAKRSRRSRRRRSELVQPNGTVAPDDLDEASAPRVVEDVAEVRVEHERVVVGGPRGGAHVLNPTAALLWEFLDGDTRLGELVDDFAAATETPREVVRSDVLEFARALGRVGLLVGVAEPVPAVEPAPPPQPTARLEPGAALEPFTFADLDGQERSLTDFRARQVFLVNWNPGCGYCEMIARPLADLEPDLAGAGIDLVLVAGGDEQANRALVERAGLQAPVLLKRDGLDPFGGLGTPAATLLDEEGRIAAALASGALEVPARAAALAGVELPNPGGGNDGAPDARHLPAAGGMCGPGAASGPSTSWAGTLAVAFGDTHVGLRYNSDATRALLEKLFVGAVVDDPTVPDNYSVALSERTGRSHELELLVQGSQQLVRSRSRRRVLAALLSYLSGALVPPDFGLLKLAATPAVATDGTALLLPPRLIESVAKLQPLLARGGITFVDVPGAVVDPASAELVVAAPGVEHDPAVLDEVDADLDLGRGELPMVAPGRYPLRAWYLPEWDPEGERETGGDTGLSPALAVASTIGQCATDDLQATADQLVALVEAVPVRPIHYESARELVDRLRER